jgi:hypothetical protein
MGTFFFSRERTAFVSTVNATQGSARLRIQEEGNLYDISPLQRLEVNYWLQK